ncbi:MATE family efflux transporter [Cochleicola gelatinilyticus]|uniref:Polysaccharide biosynthesis protein n=1 Tax=Cochleicola gelatinilyticus TaxID=1763537 RepID=A0A167G8Y6_9FLAO|nr:hypothetical protein [Cochleicola gelatinilyticus]OAB77343.1 hypothetical protein ULVI_12635 [Cochleicola gelatinilyticus]
MVYKKLEAYFINNPIFKQSALGIIFNVFSVFFSIVTISLLLEYLGKNDYGIWLTIFSICNWINFLDGGLGNGLRNELTKSLVKKDVYGATSIISTGYISISFFLISLFILLCGVNALIDWNSIVSSDKINFNLLAIFVFGFFLLQMILKLISKIYFSFDRSSFSFFIPLATNFIILIAIYLISYFDLPNKIWNVALIYSFLPLVVLSLLTFHFFYIIKPTYKPNYTYYNKKYVTLILKNGILFFLIQMSSGILQAITPFFITLWFSPLSTADYQISIKYYSFLLILLNIVLQTMWTTITASYIQKDFLKLKGLIKKKVILALGLLVTLLIMYFSSEFIYRIWLGDNVVISEIINTASVLFVATVIVSKIFTNFLNATNNIKIQSNLSITIIILYFPVVYFLVKVLHLGITALIMAPAIFFLIQMCVAIYELKRIMYKKTTNEIH